MYPVWTPVLFFVDSGALKIYADSSHGAACFRVSDLGREAQGRRAAAEESTRGRRAFRAAGVGAALSRARDVADGEARVEPAHEALLQRPGARHVCRGGEVWISARALLGHGEPCTLDRGGHRST